MRDNSKSLIATAFAHFVNDGSQAMFPVLYPLLIQFYSFTSSSIGIIGALLNGVSIITAPFIGRRSDLGRNYVGLIITGVLMIGFGAAAFAISMLFFHGLELFLILVPFALVAGFGSSFYHPLGAAILNEQFGSKNRGRAMGINGSMGSFGIMIFPIIAVALASYVSPGAVGVFGGSSAVLAAILIFFLMRRVQFGDQEEKNKISEKKSENGGAAISKAHPIPLKLILPPILALTIASFLRAMFTQSTLQFMPDYLTSVSHIGYSYVGLALAVMPGVGIISQPLFGSLADRFGRRLMFGVSTLGAGVAMLFFLSTTNIVIQEVCLAFFGLFQFTGFPLILALAIEISPKGATTISNSIVWGLGSVGGAALGPLVVGLLAESAYLGSLNSAFLVVTLIGLVSLAFIPLIPRPRRTD